MDIKVLASGSKGNCYIVSDGNTKILLEAGLPIRQIRKEGGFQLHEMQGCLISHEH